MTVTTNHYETIIYTYIYVTTMILASIRDQYCVNVQRECQLLPYVKANNLYYN